MKTIDHVHGVKQLLCSVASVEIKLSPCQLIHSNCLDYFFHLWDSCEVYLRVKDIQALFFKLL